jgi:hypothetical protein
MDTESRIAWLEEQIETLSDRVNTLKRDLERRIDDERRSREYEDYSLERSIGDVRRTAEDAARR